MWTHVAWSPSSPSSYIEGLAVIWAKEPSMGWTGIKGGVHKSLVACTKEG